MSSTPSHHDEIVRRLQRHHIAKKLPTTRICSIRPPQHDLLCFHRVKLRIWLPGLSPSLDAGTEFRNISRTRLIPNASDSYAASNCAHLSSAVAVTSCRVISQNSWAIQRHRREIQPPDTRPGTLPRPRLSGNLGVVDERSRR